ncbi:uncharacterized protein LOC135116071 [Scylla paramamosain]|uniref:uncharacterized protein LOC135116071 n=1 Tax=Scylla paramamosain TaxID=85552 RepID=UPI003082A385
MKTTLVAVWAALAACAFGQLQAPASLSSATPTAEDRAMAVPLAAEHRMRGVTGSQDGRSARGLLSSLIAPFVGGFQRATGGHRGRERPRPANWRPIYTRHPQKPAPPQPTVRHPPGVSPHLVQADTRHSLHPQLTVPPAEQQRHDSLHREVVRQKAVPHPFPFEVPSEFLRPRPEDLMHDGSARVTIPTGQDFKLLSEASHLAHKVFKGDGLTSHFKSGIEGEPNFSPLESSVNGKITEGEWQPFQPTYDVYRPPADSQDEFFIIGDTLIPPAEQHAPLQPQPFNMPHTRSSAHLPNHQHTSLSAPPPPPPPPVQNFPPPPKFPPPTKFPSSPELQFGSQESNPSRVPTSSSHLSFAPSSSSLSSPQSPKHPFRTAAPNSPPPPPPPPSPPSPTAFTNSPITIYTSSPTTHTPHASSKLPQPTPTLVLKKPHTPKIRVTLSPQNQQGGRPVPQKHDKFPPISNQQSRFQSSDSEDSNTRPPNIHGNHLQPLHNQEGHFQPPQDQEKPFQSQQNHESHLQTSQNSRNNLHSSQKQPILLPPPSRHQPGSQNQQNHGPAPLKQGNHQPGQNLHSTLRPQGSSSSPQPQNNPPTTKLSHQTAVQKHQNREPHLTHQQNPQQSFQNQHTRSQSSQKQQNPLQSSQNQKESSQPSEIQHNRLQHPHDQQNRLRHPQNHLQHPQNQQNPLQSPQNQQDRLQHPQNQQSGLQHQQDQQSDLQHPQKQQNPLQHPQKQQSPRGPPHNQGSFQQPIKQQQSRLQPPQSQQKHLQPSQNEQSQLRQLQHQQNGLHSSQNGQNRLQLSQDEKNDLQHSRGEHDLKNQESYLQSPQSRENSQRPPNSQRLSVQQRPQRPHNPKQPSQKPSQSPQNQEVHHTTLRDPNTPTTSQYPHKTPTPQLIQHSQTPAAERQRVTSQNTKLQSQGPETPLSKHPSYAPPTAVPPSGTKSSFPSSGSPLEHQGKFTKGTRPTAASSPGTKTSFPSSDYSSQHQGAFDRGNTRPTPATSFPSSGFEFSDISENVANQVLSNIGSFGKRIRSKERLQEPSEDPVSDVNKRLIRNLRDSAHLRRTRLSNEQLQEVSEGPANLPPSHQLHPGTHGVSGDTTDSVFPEVTNYNVMVLPYQTLKESGAPAKSSDNLAPNSSGQAFQDDVSVFLVQRQHSNTSQLPVGSGASNVGSPDKTTGAKREAKTSWISAGGSGDVAEMLGSLAPPPSTFCVHGFCEESSAAHSDNRWQDSLVRDSRAATIFTYSELHSPANDSFFYSQARPHDRYVCEATVKELRPGWGHSADGTLLKIINTENFPQRIRMEVCSGAVGDLCPFVPPPLASTCRQRYSLHKMAALDPQAPGGGVFQAAFRVPSGCFCQVRQQTPLPDTSGLSGGPAEEREHSQQSVTEAPVAVSTPSQRFTRTQNSGPDAFGTLDVSSEPQAAFGQHDNQGLQHQAWQDQEGSKWQDLHQQPHHNQQPHHIYQPDQQQHHQHQQQHQNQQTKQQQHHQHQNQQHHFQEHSHQQQQHQHQEHQQQNQHQQHQHQLQQTEPHQRHHHQQQQPPLPPSPSSPTPPPPPPSPPTPLPPPVPAPHEQQQQLLLLHQQESSSKGSLHLGTSTVSPNDWRPVTFSPAFRESLETSPHPLVTSYLQVTNITFSRPPSGVTNFETPPPTIGTVSPKALFQATSPITNPTLPPTTTALHLITPSTPQDSRLLGDENEFLNVEFPPPTFTTGPVTDSHHSHHPHQGIIGELNHLGVRAVGDNVQVSETGDNNFILTLQQVRQDGTQVPLELLISVDGRLISAASSLSSDSTHAAQRRRGLEDTEVDLQQLPRTVKRYVKELRGKTQHTGGSRTHDDVQDSSNSSGNVLHLALNNDTSKALILNAKLAPIKERGEQRTSDSLRASGEVGPRNRDSFRLVSSSVPKKLPFPHPARMTNAPRQWMPPPSTLPPRSFSDALQDSKFITVTTSPELSSHQITFSHRDNSFPSLSTPSSRSVPTAYPHGRESGWDISQASQSQASQLNSKKHPVPEAHRLPADWWTSQLFSERPHVIQNYFINFQDNQKKEKAASGSKMVSTSDAAEGESLTRQNLGLGLRESFARGPQKRPAASNNITRKTSLSRQRLSSLLNSTSNLFGEKSNSRTNKGFPRFTFPMIVLDNMSNDRTKRKLKGQAAPVFSLSRPRKKTSNRTIRDVGDLASNVENADTKVKIRLKFAKSLTESGYIIPHNERVLQPSSVGSSLYGDASKSIMTPSRSKLQLTLSPVSPIQTAWRGVHASSRTLGHTSPYITTNTRSSGRKGAQVWLADTIDRASFSSMEMSESQIQPQWRPSLSQGQEFALLAHPVTGDLLPFPPSTDVTLHPRPMIASAAIAQDVFSPHRHSQIHILGSQAQHRPVLASATRQPSRVREYILSPVLPLDVVMAHQRERLWGKW